MINAATFKISAFALFLLTTACAYSGEALVVPLLHNNNNNVENHDHDLENPAVIQPNNHEETAEAREERFSSARHAFICSGINFFTGAFQCYTLSACNELCNKSSSPAFETSLLTGLILTGAAGAAIGGIEILDWCFDQRTPSYLRSKLKTYSLSGLSLCASFSCGYAALNNSSHFSVINGSGVATAWGVGSYLLYKGFRQSREQPRNTNLIEDLLEPEAQV